MAGLSLLKLVKLGFEFWLPPSPDPCQHGTFRWLLRVLFLVLLVPSFWDFQAGSLWRYLIGGALLVVGFGLALRWTGFLGWRNAFGHAARPFQSAREPGVALQAARRIGPRSGRAVRVSVANASMPLLCLKPHVELIGHLRFHRLDRTDIHCGVAA